MVPVRPRLPLTGVVSAPPALRWMALPKVIALGPTRLAVPPTVRAPTLSAPAFARVRVPLFRVVPPV